MLIKSETLRAARLGRIGEAHGTGVGEEGRAEVAGGEAEGRDEHVDDGNEEHADDDDAVEDAFLFGGLEAAFENKCQADDHLWTNI